MDCIYTQNSLNVAWSKLTEDKEKLIEGMLEGHFGEFTISLIKHNSSDEQAITIYSGSPKPYPADNVPLIDDCAYHRRRDHEKDSWSDWVKM